MHREISRSVRMATITIILFGAFSVAVIIGFMSLFISSSAFVALILIGVGALCTILMLTCTKYYPVELVVERVDGDLFLTIKCKL